MSQAATRARCRTPPPAADGRLGPDVQWLQSYVVQDAIVCVYVAKSPALIEEHARRGGFPCQNIRAVATMIDASTGGA